MTKEPILSVTAKDCRWNYMAASTKGGQGANKTASGVRCTHKDSGAVGLSRDTRSQSKNKRTAFKRMTETQKFKNWVKVRVSQLLGDQPKETIEERVERMMEDIQVQTWKDGAWVDEENSKENGRQEKKEQT